MATATEKIMNQFERCPTYNELVEMIEEEELKAKPSIENVIDRKATIFRNNQYGGRFDNSDLIGLKKQEKMTQLKMLKLATMKEEMANDPDRERFSSQGAGRLPVYEEGYITPHPTEDEFDTDFALRMEQELREYDERQRQIRDFDIHDVDDMLSVVSAQQLPQGIEHYIGTPQQIFETPRYTSSSETEGQLPPLEDMDEQLPSPSSQQPAQSSENPEQSLNIGDVRETALEDIIYDDRPEVLNQLTEDALKFQLFLREIDVDDPENQLENMKKKGGEKAAITKKQYYLNRVEELKKWGMDTSSKWHVIKI